MIGIVLALGLWQVVAGASQTPRGVPNTPGLHDLVAELPDAGRVTFAISIPPKYDPSKPTPLVLSLHPGGERTPYYGSAFTRVVVEPGLRELGAIIIAPDCPTDGWTTPVAERAAMMLVEAALESYHIDRRRILVTGFSMGGRGTWFMAARHSDLFTAAIPMAASTGELTSDQLGTIPTYIIHSRDDEVVPYGPAEKNARELERMKKPVRFAGLSGLRHFEMVNYVDALRQGARWIADRWKE